MMRRLSPPWRAMLGIMVTATSGCAQLHHAQLGEIDGRDTPDKLEPFTVRVSETGLNVDEAGAIARALSRNAAQYRTAGRAQGLIDLAYMGPRTGNVVFDDTYAENINSLVEEQCPGGRITGLMAVRETRKYPVISGEIVKISGYCIKPSNPKA